MVYYYDKHPEKLDQNDQITKYLGLYWRHREPGHRNARPWTSQDTHLCNLLRSGRIPNEPAVDPTTMTPRRPSHDEAGHTVLPGFQTAQGNKCLLTLIHPRLGKSECQLGSTFQGTLFFLLTRKVGVSTKS